jgi:hypothetical protein
VVIELGTGEVYVYRSSVDVGMGGIGNEIMSRKVSVRVGVLVSAKGRRKKLMATVIKL